MTVKCQREEYIPCFLRSGRAGNGKKNDKVDSAELILLPNTFIFNGQEVDHFAGLDSQQSGERVA